MPSAKAHFKTQNGKPGHAFSFRGSPGKTRVSYQEANLDFISMSKILTKMAIKWRWKLLRRRGWRACRGKTKRGLHREYGFQWGRVNAKNSIRIKRSHNRSLWAKLSCRCRSEWAKPHTWKGCVTGAMIYKVRPKRQSFDSAKQTWLFLLGGRSIFFTEQRITVNIC